VNRILVGATLLLIKINGNVRMGTKRTAVAAPGSVSVNTTVIWYIPGGVPEDVTIVTAPLVAE
jgi:hypothetical protein